MRFSCLNIAAVCGSCQYGNKLVQAQIGYCSVAGKEGVVGNNKIHHSLPECYLCHGHSDRKERGYSCLRS